jgi:hypothetical protein
MQAKGATAVADNPANAPSAAGSTPGAPGRRGSIYVFQGEISPYAKKVLEKLHVDQASRLQTHFWDIQSRLYTDGVNPDLDMIAIERAATKSDYSPLEIPTTIAAPPKFAWLEGPRGGADRLAPEWQIALF